MPNLADGLRELIEHRMRFPTNSYAPTFVEEYEREREKERRYEEKRRAKQRQRSRERRALQKAEIKLPTIVGWIIFGTKILKELKATQVPKPTGWHKTNLKQSSDTLGLQKPQ